MAEPNDFALNAASANSDIARAESRDHRYDGFQAEVQQHRLVDEHAQICSGNGDLAFMDDRLASLV